MHLDMHYSSAVSMVRRIAQDFQKLAGGESSASASGDGGSSGDTEAIYYLETSTPHIYDISASGPYYPLEAISPQVLRNFGEDCLHSQY